MRIIESVGSWRRPGEAIIDIVIRIYTGVDRIILFEALDRLVLLFFGFIDLEQVLLDLLFDDIVANFRDRVILVLLRIDHQAVVVPVWCSVLADLRLGQGFRDDRRIQVVLIDADTVRVVLSHYHQAVVQLLLLVDYVYELLIVLNFV